MSDVGKDSISRQSQFALGRQFVELGEVSLQHHHVGASIGGGQSASEVREQSVDVRAVLGHIHTHDAARHDDGFLWSVNRDLG